MAQISGGGVGGSGSEANYAHLRIGVSPAALAGHYSAQLEEAGWSRVGGGEEGPTAWSGWTFEEAGEGWVGIFVAMSASGPKLGASAESLYIEARGGRPPVSSQSPARVGAEDGLCCQPSLLLL